MDGFRLDQEEGATTAGGGKETKESSWSSNPQVQAQLDTVGNCTNHVNFSVVLRVYFSLYLTGVCFYFIPPYLVLPLLDKQVKNLGSCKFEYGAIGLWINNLSWFNGSNISEAGFRRMICCCCFTWICASDRNLDVLRGRVSRPVKKEQNLQASPLSTRASRTRSPLHDCSAYGNKNISVNQRASLEKDIELLQLRLQQEKSMRLMLERAMGRASSTLSPGHRHFATQTKELIAEIELLQEEVANREQHVLSLYRSVFDQCVSRQPSEQSSGKASPAHMKHASRKHPSVISSAFCSSKKFPLKPWQALVSTNDSGKRISRSIDASQFCGKNDILFDKTSSHSVKAHEKVQGMEKSSVLRTLKDHLYQCPSKLSEEMVRCMAAVYCGLRGATSPSSNKNQSPLLSRSSTNVVLPRRGAGDDQDFSCTSDIEISWISTNTNQFSRASYAISNYRALVEQLEKVTVNQMEFNAQIAFWINVYNALVMHAYLAYGIPHGSLRRLVIRDQRPDKCVPN
ncbi:hypothetical protein V6Z12_D12G249700 [Gossypium hirsutum]